MTNAFDIYLRSYPLFVTNPRAMMGIILPVDSGMDGPVTPAPAIKPGYSMAQLGRMIFLLTSADRRKR